MKKGDRVLVYHTGREKAIVGVATVTKAPYADPGEKDEKLAVVDLKPVQPLAAPVALDRIKKDRRFADFELVKFSRLSVMPVSPGRFEALLAMGAA
jgi:predicted RNA-binding protein with PUA-like domain